MGCNVRRPINQEDLRFVPHIEQAMKSLPKDLRTCSECNEEVTIHKEYIPNPGDALPFADAEFVGCDAAIDRVIKGISDQQR